MKAEYFSTCLLCGSGKLSALEKFSKHHLVRCRSCGFVFSGRNPSLEELLAVYNFYPIFQTISPITVKRYNELLDYFEKFRKTNNLIDVGSGDGYFLDAAKSRGWNVFGTEFTDAKVEFSRRKGIAMHKGVLDVNNYPRDYFDALLSIEVIEHLNNPREEVSKFNTLLRPGGIVYLTTPNFNSVSKFLLGEKWNIVHYPEHLSYFTAKTIARLFRDSGFRVAKINSSGISLSRAQQSVHAPEQAGDFSMTDEKVRAAIERNVLLQAAKKSVNLVLNIFRAGDSLKAMFIKR